MRLLVATTPRASRESTRPPPFVSRSHPDLSLARVPPSHPQPSAGDAWFERKMRQRDARVAASARARSRRRPRTISPRARGEQGGPPRSRAAVARRARRGPPRAHRRDPSPALRASRAPRPRPEAPRAARPATRLRVVRVPSPVLLRGTRFSSRPRRGLGDDRAREERRRLAQVSGVARPRGLPRVRPRRRHRARPLARGGGVRRRRDRHPPLPRVRAVRPVRVGAPNPSPAPRPDRVRRRRHPAACGRRRRHARVEGRPGARRRNQGRVRGGRAGRAGR